MRCPKCDFMTRITSMTVSDENEVYRRRKCCECGHKFFTIEFEIEETEQLKQEWPRAFGIRKE